VMNNRSFAPLTLRSVAFRGRILSQKSSESKLSRISFFRLLPVVHHG
jgi:hypothetical protein